MILHARDWARPHGIPRPTQLPLDDAITDAQAALAAAVEHAYLDLNLGAVPPTGADDPRGPTMPGPRVELSSPAAVDVGGHDGGSAGQGMR